MIGPHPVVNLVKRTLLAAAASLAAALAAGQEGPASPSPAAPAPAAWAFNASLNAYFVPQSHDYLDPVVMADRKGVHLEARYNYEALHTGSFWIGWDLHVGDALSLDFTPMVGGVFGDLDGVAPGYELTLSYGQFQLYSSGEYVFDASGSDGNFLYNWSQLSWSPWEWLQVGVVGQRTRAYESSLDVQRGFLVGFTRKNWTLTAFVFNPDLKTPTVVVTLGVTF